MVRVAGLLGSHSTALLSSQPDACLFARCVVFSFQKGSCEFCCSCSFSPLVLRKVVYSFSHLYCRTVRWLGGGGGSHESFLLTLDSLTVACSSELGVSATELRHLGVGMR